MSLPSKFFIGRGGAASNPIQINQTWNASSSGRSGTPYTVTLNGTYDIEVVGSQPPRQTYAANGYDGGNPARLVGRYTFPTDTDVRILVGQKPTQGLFHGGGGGTFVSIAGNIQANDTPLIIAGGGGSHRTGGCGGVTGSGGGNASELHATYPTSLGQSQGASNNTNAGGVNGNAGDDDLSNEGGAGAGYYTDAPGGGSEVSALAYVNGGTGGWYNGTGYGEGGYGCGGAGGYGGSGGGGGYNGGGAGKNCTANFGGGGGSFASSSYGGVLLASGYYTAALSQYGHDGFVTINSVTTGSNFIGHFSAGGTFTGGSQWFSPNYYGVDTGSHSTLGPNTDIGNMVASYRENYTGNSTFWVLLFEHTGGTINTSNQQFTIRAGYRIDTANGTAGNTRTQTVTMSNQANLGQTSNVVPSNKTYYLGWYSGSGGAGYNNSGTMYADNTTASTVSPLSRIHYSSTSSTSSPQLNSTILLDVANQASYLQLGLV